MEGESGFWHTRSEMNFSLICQEVVHPNSIDTPFLVVAVGHWYRHVQVIATTNKVKPSSPRFKICLPLSWAAGRLVPKKLSVSSFRLKKKTQNKHKQGSNNEIYSVALCVSVLCSRMMNLLVFVLCCVSSLAIVEAGRASTKHKQCQLSQRGALTSLFRATSGHNWFTGWDTSPTRYLPHPLRVRIHKQTCIYALLLQSFNSLNTVILAWTSGTGFNVTGMAMWYRLTCIPTILLATFLRALASFQSCGDLMSAVTKCRNRFHQHLLGLQSCEKCESLVIFLRFTLIILLGAGNCQATISREIFPSLSRIGSISKYCKCLI